MRAFNSSQVVSLVISIAQVKKMTSPYLERTRRGLFLWRYRMMNPVRQLREKRGLRQLDIRRPGLKS